MVMIYRMSGSAFSYETDENGNVNQRKMSVSDAEQLVSSGSAVLFDSLNALKSNAQNYVANRQKEYPDWKEQLDLLYHEMTVSGSLTTSGSWYKTIKVIKDENPKP